MCACLGNSKCLYFSPKIHTLDLFPSHPKVPQGLQGNISPDVSSKLFKMKCTTWFHQGNAKRLDYMVAKPVSQKSHRLFIFQKYLSCSWWLRWTGPDVDENVTEINQGKAVLINFYTIESTTQMVGRLMELSHMRFTGLMKVADCTKWKGRTLNHLNFLQYFHTSRYAL